MRTSWARSHRVRRMRQSPRTEADCKAERAPDRTWPALEKEGMFRAPSATVAFSAAPGDDVTLNNYIRQDDRPLVSTRGRLADHFGLAVTDLDAWVAKLRRESVKFLEQPYKLGDMRAVMVEGPSREAIELVEVK